MTATCDRTALEHAIVLAPLEDTPRLVYADWCDEHGEPERAEFIRCQVELAGVSPQHEHTLTPRENGSRGREWDCDCRVCQLRRREQELWMKLHKSISAALPACSIVQANRGFPSSVTLPDLASWERWGEAIVRAAPVVEIVVSCREPHPRWNDNFGWIITSGGTIYPESRVAMIRKRLKQMSKNSGPAWAWFPDRESAILAAARAFCDESRSRAKLPPVWSKP